jgi:NtrC-family two-component system sensor histidine kinase KinB
MLGLRQKLVLSYCLLVAITLGVGAYSIGSMGRIEHAIDGIVATGDPHAMMRGQIAARRVAEHETIAIFIAIALGAGCGILFGAEFTLSVVRPITALARVAKRVGEGDLDQHIQIKSRDEVGTLAAEFNRMTVRLREFRASAAGRMELERGLSDAVLQSIFEPVIVADAQGEVLNVNRAAIALLGTEGASPLHLDSTPGGARMLQAVRDAVAMQKPVAHEGEAAILPLRIHDQERSYRMRTTPMRDQNGKLLGAVTVLEDVTELRNLDKFKTRFLAVASEKLRLPLTAIRVGLYTLGQGLAGALRPMQTEVLEDCNAQAEQLDDLLSDLIELSEVDAGARQLDLKRMRPVDMLRSTVERFEAAARSQGVELRYDAFADLSYVIVDARAQRSILDNLVSNALRFTAESGKITLEARERRGAVQFFVRDTGAGIATERLPSIFGRFTSTSTGGTGLGLALVRRLVESMGGQIAVESTLGAGTVFSFTLPAAVSPATQHPVELG